MEIKNLKNNLLTDNPVLASEWHPSKNGDLSPDMITTGSNKKVWWLGKCGHEWQAKLAHRNKGVGCPICSNKQILIGYNDLATINPELAKEWHPTRNGGLTPEAVTANSHKKVWWLDEYGHEWQADVGGRNTGRGCPFCSGRLAIKGYNDLLTINPRLAKEWNYTKNDNLTPEMVKPNSNKKVWWAGKCGHEWQASIASRNNGNNCPICSNQQVLRGYNDLATINPVLTKEWHPTKNGDLTAEMVVSNSNRKIWWLGACKHEWRSSIRGRKKGIGCPICSSNQVLIGYNDLATINPELAKEWHPTKNNGMAPENVMSNSSKKAWWLGACKHEWEARISGRNKGAGCPICSNKQVKKGYNDLATTNPELAEEWHPTKNGDLTPEMITAGSEKKAWWIGTCGHEWKSVVGSRNQGIGCPICSGRQTLKGYNDLATTNPELVKEWHPIKNGNLTPEMFTANSTKKVWWQCDYGHEWYISPNGRNRGRGCPICAKELQTSFPEQAIFYYVKNVFATTVNSFKIGKNFEIDIYIDELRLGIEYDGAVWHQSPEKDKEKNLLCKNYNIELIRIREKNCPALDDETYCIVLEDYSIAALERAIKKIFIYITEKVTQMDYKIEIDITKEEHCINELFIQTGKQNSLFSKNPKLALEWHPTMNGKLTPEMFAASSHKKVWWICSHRHEWQASINKRNNGRGCPFCSNNKVLKEYNDLMTTNPKLANEWHPTRNEKLTPEMVTAGSSRKKVWWLCGYGHEWQATVCDRSRGKSCPICSSIAIRNPELAKEWNPIKNGELTPEMITAGSSKKVWWQCRFDHEWQAVINNRVNGRGCPFCSNNQVLQGYNDLTTINPELANEWHPTKNEKLTPEMVTVGSNKKVWWHCLCGHEWQSAIYDRNKGRGCPICYKEKRSKDK